MTDEAFNRPDRLYYTGDGDLFFYGVPARDLEPEDIAVLDDATIKNITAPMPGNGKQLYRRTKPSAQQQERQPTPTPPKSDNKAEKKDGGETPAG